MGTIRIVRNGFVYYESYQRETQFVGRNIKIGYAISLATVRQAAIPKES